MTNNEWVLFLLSSVWLRLMWSLNALDGGPFARFWHFIDRKNNPHWFIFRVCVLCVLLLFVVLATIFRSRQSKLTCKQTNEKHKVVLTIQTLVEFVCMMCLVQEKKNYHFVFVGGQHPSNVYLLFSHLVSWVHAHSAMCLWFARCTTASFRLVCF